jgi:prophage maintenance system killer protein
VIPWLRRETLILLHERHTQDWPTTHGLRDDDILERILEDVQMSSNLDPVSIAATYAARICRYRPFNNGNKHVALGACVTFLEMNSLELVTSSLDIIRKFNDLEADEINQAALEGWLREVCHPIKA